MKFQTKGYLTDEDQIEEVEEPFRETFAKDWPAVILFLAAPGINSRW